MSHGNLVVLNGEFRVLDKRFVEMEGREILEVEATVQTGPRSHGGVHTIILYSETARKANAYVTAYGGDGMAVTVSGSLFSGDDESRVYVEWMSFPIPKHLAEKGQNLFVGGRDRTQRGFGIMS